MLKFLLKALLLAAAMVFAVSLVLALLLMGAVWLLRAAWARLTGKPVVPFATRVNPRSGWQFVVQRGRAGGPAGAGVPAGTSAADATPALRRKDQLQDVTDVEAR